MAYRPNPEQPTPYEELGGGIREPWRDDEDMPWDPSDEDISRLSTERPTKVHGQTRRRPLGRSINEPDNELAIEPTYVARTPEEREELLARLQATRDYYARHTAMSADTPTEQYDDERRGALRWAANLAAEANVAYGAAHVLSDETHPNRDRMGRYRDSEHALQIATRRTEQAEKLASSACAKCIFVDRCDLVGAEVYVVQSLRDKTIRKEFVDAMSGPYGSSYVSCESVIKP
jgi:hypothetical protein